MKFGDDQTKEYFVPIKERPKERTFDDVKDSLDAFFAPSISEGYSCSSCGKEDSNCSQQFYMKDLSKYLIIYLKRFVFEGEYARKNTISIQNSMEINLGKYVVTENENNEYKYKL